MYPTAPTTTTGGVSMMVTASTTSFLLISIKSRQKISKIFSILQWTLIFGVNKGICFRRDRKDQTALDIPHRVQLSNHKLILKGIHHLGYLFELPTFLLILVAML